MQWISYMCDCVWNFVRIQHVRLKTLLFLNCCGIFHSNYFQAAHQKITIKIASNNMTYFFAGLVLCKNVFGFTGAFTLLE